MKKAILYLCGIALLFAGCAKEQVVEPVIEETAPRHLTFDITVNHDGPDTRAVKTGWEKGDKIYVFFDLNAQTTTAEYMTMTYDGSKWSYKFSNETLETYLLEKTSGSVFAFYVPYGTPTFSYDSENKRININGLVENKVGISYSYCREKLYKVENDILSANLDMQLGPRYVQFYIPWVKDASNLTFQCNYMKADIPSYISLSSPTSPAVYTAGLTGFDNEKVKGFIYDGGMIVCGTISADSAQDYTLEVTNTRGTTIETDDLHFKASFKNKTLKEHDAVLLSNLSRETWEKTSNGHEFVHMADGHYWAPMNVGAEKPEDYGNYYTWTKDNTTQIQEIEQAWGGHVPSADEFDWLKNNCTWEWKENYNNSGHNGMLVTNKSTYNSIFLPAGGFGNGEFERNERGWYITSSFKTSFPFTYSFNDQRVTTYDNNYHLSSVRLVF